MAVRSRGSGNGTSNIFDRAPHLLLTDSLRLQQIVTNLISNAIRYTESGTIIADFNRMKYTHNVGANGETALFA